jgi:hypothetical protein
MSFLIFYFSTQPFHRSQSLFIFRVYFFYNVSILVIDIDALVALAELTGFAESVGTGYFESRHSDLTSLGLQYRPLIQHTEASPPIVSV